MEYWNLIGYIPEQAYTAQLSKAVPIAAGKEINVSTHDDAPRHMGVAGMLSAGKTYTGDVFSPQVSKLRAVSMSSQQFDAVTVEDDLGG